MTDSIIAHLTSGHQPFDIRIFHKECISLASHGYKVFLVAPKEGMQVEQFDGVTVIPVKKPTRLWKRLFLTGFIVVQAALRVKPDVMHLHDAELLIWAPFLRLIGKRVIFDMHENMPKSIETKTWIHKKLRKPMANIFRLVERLLLTGVPVIYAEKSYAADYPFIRKSCFVLNMPILSRLLDLEKTPNREPTFGFLGAVGVERGSLLTLESLAELKAKGIKVKWECMGNITRLSHRPELENKVKELGLEEQITFHGYLPPQEGWKELTKCWCGIAVALPTPNNYGSCSTKIFEYMALGLPFITSDFPVYREVVDRWNCGICIDPLKSEELTAAMLTILENPELSKKMGERGRSAVQFEYNWVNESKKLIDFYQGLGYP